ncbi:MBL fold metallo-hydrolase [Paludibacterium yongneupense]|uniref:MBL fold metallo-hydrolase n=1 Tax=Paludibacterium yongneupense TaxID=400061 RepID=UPI00041363E5|nr:MBL fold metallo-hydrolase [Paludibacterium yongneupense]
MLSRFKTRSLLAAATLAFGIAAAASAADALKLDVYNPGAAALFPVSSVLVSGEHDAILIDAQFGKSQAAELVARIRASGKTLTTIYISHGDPDYYFGLETLRAAFPDARIVASAPTVAHIRQTMAAKLAFWGPKLGADAPTATVLPETLNGDSLQLEGRRLDIVGLHGRQAERSFVWIPSLKAVVGGVVLFNNQHVWMADTQSAQSHADWLATLRTIARLKPRIVVPGHALPGASTPLQSVAFTAGYIRAFDAAAARYHDSRALIAAMKARYPQAGEEGSLEISAKVASGEMKW